MRIKGTIGEIKAASYLKGNGFELLKQNYYTPFGEIDIIAKKHRQIHIIEVKLLKQELIHLGYKLNYRKKQRMIRCALLFMDQSKLDQFYYQFDLITIISNQIKHYENVFNLNDALR